MYYQFYSSYFEAPSIHHSSTLMFKPAAGDEKSIDLFERCKNQYGKKDDTKAICRFKTERHGRGERGLEVNSLVILPLKAVLSKSISPLLFKPNSSDAKKAFSFS